MISHESRLVFVSHESSLDDAQADDSLIRAALLAIGAEPGFHYDQQSRTFPAASGSPREHCERRVAAADVFLAVVGFKYGTHVDPNDPGSPSYCELEYQIAVEHNLPCLVMIWSPSGVPPRRLDWRQIRFQEDLRARQAFVTFETASELTFKLRESLRALVGAAGIRLSPEAPADIDLRRPDPPPPLGPHHDIDLRRLATASHPQQSDRLPLGLQNMIASIVARTSLTIDYNTNALSLALDEPVPAEIANHCVRLCKDQGVTLSISVRRVDQVGSSGVE